MFLGAVLARHARYRPNHLAVAFEDERLTYDAFNKRINRIANALIREGIEKGTKFSIILPNCLEHLELYWAAAKIGAVVVPLNPLLNAKTAANLICHSHSEILFAGGDFTNVIDTARTQLSITDDRLIAVGNQVGLDYRTYADFITGASSEEPPDAGLSDQDPLTIVYSSGTTGDPKGIVLNHYVRSMYCMLYALAWRMTPESVSLHTGSLTFNGAFMTLLPTFFIGGTYILHRKFDPVRVVDTIEHERVTHMAAVPTQITTLLNNVRFCASSLNSIEALISLGETLHLRHKERLNELLPGRVYEMYGLAEGFMTVLDSTEFEAKMASVGTPPPFFEMRILQEDGHLAQAGEVGEIVGRGPIIMQGYHERSDLTDQALVDGWLRTGDLGYVDGDGYLYLVDRKKDMVKSGGISVYPRDIEDVMLQHPSVTEAVVFGVPDEKWGETPVAAVVTVGGKGIDPKELREWLNANVSAKFQRVSDLVILDSFPQNAAGKVLKRAIRAQYLEKTQAHSADA